jgi:hypothetical protein
MKEQIEITMDVIASSTCLHQGSIIKYFSMHRAEGALTVILCDMHLLIWLSIRDSLHAKDIVLIEDIGDGRTIIHARIPLSLALSHKGRGY